MLVLVQQINSLLRVTVLLVLILAFSRSASGKPDLTPFYQQVN